jgi:insertion element IS1 protein InsB
MSMRGVERVFAVPRNRLAEWLIEEAESLPSLSSTLDEAREDDVLELDEMWSFVLKKRNKRWIWLALCRRTRQIVASTIGDRSEDTCRKLWKNIPPEYRTCQSFSDFWNAYQKVFPEETHQSVGKDSGETNHIERWNNTLRQRLGRFVRRTLSFSKSDYFHEIVLRIFIFRYNLLRLKTISQV